MRARFTQLFKIQAVEKVLERANDVTRKNKGKKNGRSPLPTRHKSRGRKRSTGSTRVTKIADRTCASWVVGSYREKEWL